MRPGLVDVQRPNWVTDEVAREMAEQVAMCCAEDGYPDVTFYPTGRGGAFAFRGAPDDVLRQAGELVRRKWGIDAD